MLSIKNIRKEYKTGDLTQIALNNVSLNFREHELVAILGPSGSGKSTLLNVIGGLDQYDSGDLIIDGISTKQYKDADWDSYRNHSVGFIFQSYNLIPHQSLLANVELALTISGVSKKDRKKRALEALESVGLGNQAHKKPNQLSGGQMQRVAIARALVNNPKIILADEPTGALDSQTSIQVMNILKEVSKDRLVIMVTHNPELAEQYSDRLVKVKDGQIIDDSNPFEINESLIENATHKNMGKSSMSFMSSLILSFNNLKNKKGRTLLTAFAGSIGIIGIALIMSLSTGFQNYIDDIQADTLANNPLTLASDTANFMGAFTPVKNKDNVLDENIIVEQPTLSSIFKHIGTNNLSAFKETLEDNYDQVKDTINAIQYHYNIRPQVYLVKDDENQKVNPSTMFKDLTGNELLSAMLDVDVFQEMVDNQDLLNSQYQLLAGNWPTNYNELVFVLPAPNKLSDQVAYTLGLKDMDSLEEMINLMAEKEQVVETPDIMQWSYDDLLNMHFKLISPSDLYKKNTEYNIWEDMSDDQEYVNSIIKNGEDLKVVGIICPQPGKSTTSLTPGIAYTSDLTKHIIDQASNKEIVKEQLNNEAIDVFSGKSFELNEDDKEIDFENMISIDTEAISNAFGTTINGDEISNLIQKYLNEINDSVNIDTSVAQNRFIDTLSTLTSNMLNEYMINNINEDGKVYLSITDIEPTVTNYLKSEEAQNEITKLHNDYALPNEAFEQVYSPLMIGLLTDAINTEVNAPNIEIKPTETPLPDLQQNNEIQNEDASPDETNDQEVVINEETNNEEVVNDDEVVNENEVDMPVLLNEENKTPDLPTLPEIEEQYSIELTTDKITTITNNAKTNTIVKSASNIISKKMMEPVIVDITTKKISEFGNAFSSYIANSFYVNEDALANSFKFNVSEEEITRIIQAMSTSSKERSFSSNLAKLGYADLNNPKGIDFYFNDFDSKEEFMTFLNNYNEQMKTSEHEENIIQYTDMAGMMMESVKSIIDSISYVLIALVAVSLLVSSIMIGIITYISVMERTKEIGLLRALGASKHNIAQVFNAETFIIGLCSGLIGIGISLLLLIPGNHIIHMIMGSDITAELPVVSSIILITLSMILTIIGGLIPSRQASKKDPVVALRSE